MYVVKYLVLHCDANVEAKGYMGKTAQQVATDEVKLYMKGLRNWT
jgi:hypothetical protein